MPLLLKQYNNGMVYCISADKIDEEFLCGGYFIKRGLKFLEK